MDDAEIKHRAGRETLIIMMTINYKVGLSVAIIWDETQASKFGFSANL